MEAENRLLVSINRFKRSTFICKRRYLFEHQNLNTITEKQLRKIRGKDIAMIMQQGTRAFDPSTKVGSK